MLRTYILTGLAFIFISLLASDMAFARNNPRIKRRDTMRQLHPRRYPHKYYDERGRKAQDRQPTLGHTWMFNGRVRNSSHYQLTGKTFHTISGRRALQDRAGRLIINNNRQTMLRRRSTRNRW